MKFWTERLPALRELAASGRVLHIGAGAGERLGVSVDIMPSVRPSVVANLDGVSFPFRSDTFDAVVAISIIEHLTDFFGVMGEIHRVLKPGGFAAILTPHFSNDGSYIDPTHRLHLSGRSFDYFVEGTSLHKTWEWYTTPRFRIKRRLVMLEPPWQRLAPVRRAANRFLRFYEKHLCFVIRAQGIYVELEAVK